MRECLCQVWQHLVGMQAYRVQAQAAQKGQTCVAPGLYSGTRSAASLDTQDLFYEDDSVLFIDMHQNEVWPGSGHVNESGRGKGEGTTINVPMPGTPAHADML